MYGLEWHSRFPTQGPLRRSKYKGISFWAKRGDKSTDLLYFRLPDVNTTPDGGVCKDCFNDFAANVKLTKVWKKYTFPFDSLKQEPGWGEPRAHITPSKIYELQWPNQNAKRRLRRLDRRHQTRGVRTMSWSNIATKIATDD